MRAHGKTLAEQGLTLPPVRMSSQAINARRDVVRATTDGASNATNFATPPPATVNDGMGNYFEALRTSKDRSQIPYAMVHLRPQILRLLNGLNRKLLAAIGRYLVDNTGPARYAVNTIANYAVPVKPRAITDDPTVNVLHNEFFAEWAERADFTRRYSLEDMQRIACIAIDTDGDLGAVITPKDGMPKLRFYDTFHIGTLTGLDPKDGVMIDDKDGTLLGYNVVNGPLETLTGAQLKFLPYDQLLLLRDPERYNFYRGYSPMRVGSNDLRDFGDIKAFHKTREKIWAALAAVIQDSGAIEEDVWGDDTGADGNAPAADAPKSEKRLSLAELLGGDIPVIDGELKQLQTQSPGVDTLAFLDFLSGMFAEGLGIPAAFYLDDKLTGPNVRSVMGKMQKNCTNRLKTICKLVKFCWVRVIAWGIDTKQIPAIDKWWKVGFQTPSLVTIDLGDQNSSDREDVACGQMTRRERFGNRGLEWQMEEDEISREDDYVLEQCRTQADKHGVPIELILAKRGFNPAQGRPMQPQQQGQGQQGQQQQPPPKK